MKMSPRNAALLLLKNEWPEYLLHILNIFHKPSASKYWANSSGKETPFLSQGIQVIKNSPQLIRFGLAVK